MESLPLLGSVKQYEANFSIEVICANHSFFWYGFPNLFFSFFFSLISLKKLLIQNPSTHIMNTYKGRDWNISGGEGFKNQGCI